MLATLLVVLLQDDLLSTFDTHAADEVILQIYLFHGSDSNGSNWVGKVRRSFILG